MLVELSCDLPSLAVVHFANATHKLYAYVLLHVCCLLTATIAAAHCVTSHITIHSLQ